MRILVYPHDLRMGGSQLNAIQIAAAVHRLGHETVVYGQPGPLVDAIRAAGLEFIAAPRPLRRPSPRVVSHLRGVISARGVDVVHGYEWPPALEAALATVRSPAVAVGTVMSMAVAPFLPHSMPLVVGTEQIAAAERLAGRRRVAVIEPPVDLTVDGDGATVDVRGFCERFGLTQKVPTVVVVSRLATELKLEGLLAAIRTVAELRSRRPVRLLIVGDGAARGRVEEAAREANLLAGPGTVLLTGELSDPRPAYALADVALGMGGSALRAMAFGKPLIVQGEGGFWKLLTPDSFAQFAWSGWYGYGTAVTDGDAALRAPLQLLLDDPDLRRRLGDFSRRMVAERFSLETAARRQVEVYAETLESGVARPTRQGLTAVGTFCRYQGRTAVARALGRSSSEDFNARPLARDVDPAATGGPPVAGPAVLWFAGVPWDAVAGTDKHLVRALTKHRPVVWVDPPAPYLTHRRTTAGLPPVTQLGPDLLRVHPVAPPGVSRPVLRWLAHWHTSRTGLEAARRWRRGLGAVVVSTARQPFPRGVGVTRAYFETDDFVAGAELFGVSKDWVAKGRRRNASRSTIVLAVTDELAQRLGELGGRPHHVLPNGCEPERYAASVSAVPSDVDLPAPRAGIVGHLNDRLDFGILEEVAERGVNLLLVGPRSSMSPGNDRRLDGLLQRENVCWVGAKSLEQLPSYLAAINVGLTPYADSAFNRASFPLKTLEYLAAGVPVVSTDLPAARALGTEEVEIACGPEDFAKAVIRMLENPGGPRDAERRRAFATRHSWSARAADLFSVLGGDKRMGELTKWEW